MLIFFSFRICLKHKILYTKTILTKLEAHHKTLISNLNNKIYNHKFLKEKTNNLYNFNRKMIILNSLMSKHFFLEKKTQMLIHNL